MAKLRQDYKAVGLGLKVSSSSEATQMLAFSIRRRSILTTWVGAFSAMKPGAQPDAAAC